MQTDSIDGVIVAFMMIVRVTDIDSLAYQRSQGEDMQQALAYGATFEPATWQAAYTPMHSAYLPIHRW